VFSSFRSKLAVDGVLFASLVPLILAGILTLRPLSFGENDYFFTRQIVWIALGISIFFLFSSFDWSFLKNSGVLIILFFSTVISLVLLLVLGKAIRGASGWFHYGLFAVQPADPAKLLLIIILSKYFSRRHVDIAKFRHIIISAVYVALPAGLILIQPDFGSAAVLAAIWFGMILASGINKKQFFIVIGVLVCVFLVSWLYILKPYQKQRIITFVNPYEDPRGAGYNALQSMIAVGSGRVFGKGMGHGTQSRLEFLPEHQTDFIFAAFAEEWGLIGVLIIFLSFGILIWRILKNGLNGEGNFERFFALGMSIFLMAHFVLHVGMNVGLLPITGLNMPFMSYGGSNIVTIFAGLGILMSMRKHASFRGGKGAAVEFLGA
jgi:rod shape determining protein RodA